MMFAQTHDTCCGFKQSLCEVIYVNVLPWLGKICTGHYSTDRQIDGQVISIYPLTLYAGVIVIDVKLWRQ